MSCSVGVGGSSEVVTTSVLSGQIPIHPFIWKNKGLINTLYILQSSKAQSTSPPQHQLHPRINFHLVTLLLPLMIT